jgi:uncharacterized protein
MNEAGMVDDPRDMVGRAVEWQRLAEFAGSGEPAASLGIVWGRRRTGKSFLLQSLVERTGGFYYEAVRGASAEALRELGARIGAHQGAAAPLALDGWDAAVGALLALGSERETLVVLDEYPYLLEHTPELDSVVQRAFGPRHPARTSSRTRLVLCGSAMAVMSRILSGTAPLRGRAGMDLRISPFDFRVARELHGIEDLRTAFRTYAVIGGVAAYAREMVDGDLPRGPADFDRWVARRVLSPSAPLFSEIGLLLSEDPTTSKARKLNLYHATLAGIATGHHAHKKLSTYVKLPGASLAPIVDALVAAELVERILDPVRENRPTYHPSDPLIRFHYAVIRRHHARLARHDADTGGDLGARRSHLRFAGGRPLLRGCRPGMDRPLRGPADAGRSARPRRPDDGSDARGWGDAARRRCRRRRRRHGVGAHRARHRRGEGGRADHRTAPVPTGGGAPRAPGRDAGDQAPPLRHRLLAGSHGGSPPAHRCRGSRSPAAVLRSLKIVHV